MDIINSSFPITGFLESKQGGRAENQDFLGYADTPMGFLLVLCDGMGGGPGGRLASESTVSVVIDYVKQKGSNCSPKQVLVDAIDFADTNIQNLVASNPSLTGMGTTIVCFLFSKKSAWVAHVGDSRFYQFRMGRKAFRTTDHSFVSELVQKGTLTEEQARLSSQSNIITRAINGRGIAKPDIVELPFEKGDRFMLCTDGIWGSMPEPELMNHITKTKNLSGAVVQMAYDVDEIGRNEGGKHDNLTIALVETKINSQKKVPMSKRILTIVGVMAVMLVTSIAINFFVWQSRNARVVEVEKQLNDLQDTITALRSKYDVTTGQLVAASDQNDKLKEENKQATKELIDAKKENAKQQGQIDQLQEQNKDLQSKKEKSVSSNPKSKYGAVISAISKFIEDTAGNRHITENSINEIISMLSDSKANKAKQCLIKAKSALNGKIGNAEKVTRQVNAFKEAIQELNKINK